MEINMTRVKGGNSLPLVEIASRRRQHYRVRTDFRPYEDEEGSGVTFIEAMFPYKPTMQDVKDFCIAVIDAQTDEKILNGYQWRVLHGDDAGRTVNVWLSAENKENYKAKYDTAKDSPELVTWPAKFKVSENDDKTPVYEYFANVDELKAFYYGGLSFIETAVNDGWRRKDNFDWTPYEEALSRLQTTK